MGRESAFFEQKGFSAPDRSEGGGGGGGAGLRVAREGIERKSLRKEHLGRSWFGEKKG